MVVITSSMSAIEGEGVYELPQRFTAAQSRSSRSL